jgi:F-type H+-transporting ATPase subunit b
MNAMVHQLGIFLLAAAAPATPPEPSLIDQVGQLLLGAVPTSLLFIVVVLFYQFLVQTPLSRTLRERHARTEGAVEEAHKAISRAEQRAGEYAEKLRHARIEILKLREHRMQQWNTERDAALDAARRSAGEKVSQAKAELDAQAAQARHTIEASASELAARVVRAVLPMAAGGTR